MRPIYTKQTSGIRKAYWMLDSSDTAPMKRGIIAPPTILIISKDDA